MKSYNEMAESVLKRRDEYKTKRRKITQGLTVAVCCCTMILGGAWMMNEHTHLSKFDMGENENGIVDLESVKTYGKEQSALNDDDSNYVPFNTEHEEVVENEDNYVESSEIAALSEKIPDVFGGYYLNEKGEFVVILTEDTPENRAMICEELGRSESNTVFEIGEFTYMYLTQLQEKISKGMMDKELPFVVVSVLRDDTNRIHISVTTEDQELIKKVLAYDTVGGAIVVEYSEGQVTQDLLETK